MSGIDTMSFATAVAPVMPDVDYSINFPESDTLASLDIEPFFPGSRANTLKGLNLIVIGGGPAGLAFARTASAYGAKVIELEKAGDPRSGDAGYTDRSFNITLESVGRQALGNMKLWQGGVRVMGRAIHSYHEDGTVRYTRYGSKTEDDLISIPRPVLRQNMINAAIEAGTTLLFNTRVTDLDPDKGTVQYIDSGGEAQTLSADLIVVCDGLHSIGDQFLLKMPNAERYFEPEKRSCVSALIPTGHRLSPNYIHFWHEPSGAYTIGVPNVDGSMGLLLVSDYNDVAPKGTPFSTLENTRTRLESEFPHLYSQAPELAALLPGKQMYKFYYKAVSSFIIGDKAVLVGDAGCVMPPWAAFGANSAMYGAASLGYQLVEHGGNIGKALEIYQAQELKLSRLILDFVNDQGEFLSGPVLDQPEARSETSLAPLIELARQQANATIPR